MLANTVSEPKCVGGPVLRRDSKVSLRRVWYGRGHCRRDAGACGRATVMTLAGSQGRLSHSNQQEIVPESHIVLVSTVPKVLVDYPSQSGHLGSTGLSYQLRGVTKATA